MRHTFQWGERTYCVTWPSWTGTELWNLKVRVQRGAYQAFVFKLSSMFWIYYGYKYISTNRYFAIKRWIAISVNTLWQYIVKCACAFFCRWLVTCIFFLYSWILNPYYFQSTFDRLTKIWKFNIRKLFVNFWRRI